MRTNTIELDVADGCLSGVESVSARIEYAIKHYANLDTEASPEFLWDKYRITVIIDLMHKHSD